LLTFSLLIGTALVAVTIMVTETERAQLLAESRIVGLSFAQHVRTCCGWLVRQTSLPNIAHPQSRFDDGRVKSVPGARGVRRGRQNYWLMLAESRSFPPGDLTGQLRPGLNRWDARFPST
jgi:hypothetical protein